MKVLPFRLLMLISVLSFFEYGLWCSIGGIVSIVLMSSCRYILRFPNDAGTATCLIGEGTKRRQWIQPNRNVSLGISKLLPASIPGLTRMNQ